MAPARDRSSAYSGVLNLNKPTGLTSHDVVDRVRRAAGTRRVGHAGTLDPAASGVILVCLGPATRVSDYLMAGAKRYRAVICFGATSDTDDAAGVVTSTGQPVEVEEAALRAALARFVGEILQVPPAYAAIKVRGQPAYRRARAGEALDLAPRAVRIDALQLVAWAPPHLTLDIDCSKGTYVRALARDLGAAVGTGAYLLALVRLASGSFTLADALLLDDVDRASNGGYLDRLLYPPDVALADRPAAFFDAADVQRLRSGLAWPGPPALEGQLARAYDRSSGGFVAVLRYDGRAWHPDRFLAVEPSDGDD